MRKLPIAAVALLFGTSAYAVIPPAEPTGVMVPTDAHEIGHAGAMTPLADEGAVQPAAVDWWAADAAKPVDVVVDDAKAEAVDPADDADAWATAAAAKAAAENATAKAGAAMDTASKDVELVTPASLETGLTDDSAAAPAAVAVETAAADLAPQPAAQNYPACRPGPGDDRCIQLYETGVQARLASWTQPTGGFAGAAATQTAMGGPDEPADSASETERLNRQVLASLSQPSDTAVAMGGPYEPVADEAMSHETAMNGDGNVETALGETADEEDVGEV